LLLYAINYSYTLRYFAFLSAVSASGDASYSVRMPYIQTNKQLIAAVSASGDASISYSPASNDTVSVVPILFSFKAY
jgi:uncharacterized protein (UPF0333 family)